MYFVLRYGYKPAGAREQNVVVWIRTAPTDSCVWMRGHREQHYSEVWHYWRMCLSHHGVRLWSQATPNVTRSPFCCLGMKMEDSQHLLQHPGCLHPAMLPIMMMGLWNWKPAQIKCGQRVSSQQRARDNHLTLFTSKTHSTAFIKVSSSLCSSKSNI